MGRGLGKTQQAILDHLQRAGKPCSIQDIAWSLYHAREGVRETEPLPRAFAVSVRRAAHTLAAHGKLECSRIKPKLRIEQDWRLVCWLPEHTPPDKDTMPGPDVFEEAILTAVRLGAAHEDDIARYLREEYYVPKAEKFSERPSGAIPYSWLTRRLHPRLDPDFYGFHNPRTSVAIHRAVWRLIKSGHLIVRGSRGRFVWLMLPS